MSGGARVPAPGVTDLDGNQVMMVVGGEPDLLGPDLRKLPTLSDQLNDLDEARATGDLDTYAYMWLAIAEENGAAPLAFWDSKDGPTAPANIMLFVAMDDQERQRRLRRDALSDHQRDVSGFIAAAERELILRWRYSDNRDAPAWEVKAVLRAFLATGSALLLREADSSPARNTRPKIELRFDYAKITIDDEAAPFIAATAMVRLLRRWRADRRLLRIVTSLGTRTTNGWYVLTSSEAVLR